MICHRTRTIFVHQRKSAGSSVISLFPGAERQPYIDGTLDPNWGNDECRRYYSFTVVRNPYDRFISGWKYLPSTRRRPLADVLAHLPRPLPGTYVFDGTASAAARYRDGLEWLGWKVNEVKFAARAAIGRPPLRPAEGGHDHRHLTQQQWESCLDGSGALALSRVVFFERLGEGLAQVFSDIGQPAPDLPHHRPTPGRQGYRDAFDADTRAAFERLYARDIAIWGYDFDTGLPGTDAASITDLSQLTPAPPVADPPQP